MGIEVRCHAHHSTDLSFAITFSEVEMQIGDCSSSVVWTTLKHPLKSLYILEMLTFIVEALNRYWIARKV